ncbi:tyrosine protein kinase [Paenibacillus sonchi]|uniref:tyrosine protein kinase n=1 Tax=Paenibacillus sonchi TaxID=373687 RepID=UPI001F425DE1|nr:tyrosine protein kinase [Paenibacillus sonchi]
MPHHYYNHSRRGTRSLAEPYPSSPYPGISSYAQPPLYGEAAMLPAAGAEAAAETALAVPVAEAATAKPGGLLGSLGNLGNLGNLANMEQIKGIVDRLGGIDGIVSSMGKVQKVMQGFQQMAPMVKLVMGSFGKKKARAVSLPLKRMLRSTAPNGARRDASARSRAKRRLQRAAANPPPLNAAASRRRLTLLASRSPLIHAHLNQPLRRNQRTMPAPSTSISRSTPK